MCMGGRIIGYPCHNCPPHIRPLQHIPVPPVQQSQKVVVPLVGASASVKIVDFLAEVTIKQRYQNTETVPIEAVYEFPLDAKASVCGFWVEIDDNKIVGEIKEKEKARNTYDDAIASGHGAYLLEEDEEKPNVFTASVGNLPPQKEVLVVIVYVTELEFEAGKLKFLINALPYAPDGKSSPKFVVPTFRDGPYSKEVGYGLRISIDMKMTSDIKSISSPSHPVSFEFGSSNQNATVTLANPDGTPLVNDFVLAIALQKPHEPCARVQQDASGNKVAMLCLYPELDEEEAQVYTEMIFVVDRSGSMSGARINSVKETMQVFLRSLPEGTLFNIIGFGTSFEKLFKDGSQEYNDKTFKAAIDHVNKLNANLGGTNVLNPLMAIFKEKAKEGIPRQIFLLTDGEVDNTDECIKSVRQHSNTTRVFTFGIGADASKKLVNGIAKAGEGYAEFIKHGENMDDKVMRQLERALKPALTDLRVDWGGLKVDQSPFHLPPLFGGSRLLVYGYLPKDATPATAKLTAHTGKSAVSFTVQLDPAAVEPGDLILKLAAKSMIRDLEEGRSHRHTADGVLLSGASVKDDVVKLSLASGIVSKFTAFVAVEKRADAVEGEMQLRRLDQADLGQLQELSKRRSVPAAPSGGLAYAYHSMAPAAHASSAGSSFAAPVMKSMMPASARSAPPPKKNGGGLLGKLSGFFGGGASAPAADSAPRAPSSSSRGRGGAAPMMKKKMSATAERERSAPPPMARLKAARLSDNDDEDESEEDGVMAAPLEAVALAPMAMEVDAIFSQSDAKMAESSVPSFDDFDYAAPVLQPTAAMAAPPPPPAPSPQAAPSFSAAAEGRAKKDEAPSGPTPADINAVRDLIKTQRANGSFGIDALAQIVKGSTAQSLRQHLPTDVAASAEVDELFVTAIVCAYFAAKWANLMTNWNLVVKKSQGWIKKEAARLKLDSLDWSVEANRFLEANGIHKA